MFEYTTVAALSIVAALVRSYLAIKSIDSSAEEKPPVTYTYNTVISPDESYEKQAQNYIKGGWTRHEAFSQILHDNPPRSEYQDGDIVVLNVRLNSNGHTYC